MIDSCLQPELVKEITLQPVRRHGVDAAIFFSDIVIPLRLAGIDVVIEPGVGPVVADPIRTRAQLEGLAQVSPDALEPIRSAVSLLVGELGQTPLIGFGGAPFTLASYLIEGGPSRDLPHSRRLMAEDPQLWRDILDWCADVTATFIEAQVESGASALQVFDSWAGRLSRAEYLNFAAPSSTRLFDKLRSLSDSSGQEVPRIHFGVNTGGILREMKAAGATVMGIDSETSLAEANEIFGGKVPLQGNIPVSVLNQDIDEVERVVSAVIESGLGAPGHVVNLGHGVPPETNPDVLTKIVEFVHAHSVEY